MNNYKMNNWFYHILPHELQTYIKSIASADLIKRLWHKRIQSKINIIQTIIKLKYNISYPTTIPSFNPISLFVSNLFLRAYNILSGIEDYSFWSTHIIFFAYSIRHYRSFNYLPNYYTSKYYCLKLGRKFNIYNQINNIINNIYP